jgi:membrane-bound lytic murein transglycosylase A
MSGSFPRLAWPCAPDLSLHHVARATAVLIIAGVVAGCSSAPIRSSQRPANVPPAPILSTNADGQTIWERGKARWVQARWETLPGWQSDKVSEVWSALWRSCQRPLPDWQGVCNAARVMGPGWGRDVGDETVRRWLQAQLQPWQVVTLDGQASGLMTGYFEPMIDARRQPQGAFQTPLYRAPADLGQRKPYYTRAELETLPDGRSALAGRELVYVADPLDALLAQVQGSTRIRLLDDLSPQGQPKVIRLAFAGHNDQPYQSVARWLVDQGAFPLEQASWPAIKAWAGMNPQRVSEMLRANPRVVFFKEEALVQPDNGPLGAQGVPLTPGRSIAVDKDATPYGSLVWLETTEPQPWSSTPPVPKPMQRLVVAQDTGSAITGAVRADYFWGWGDEALAQAGRTKQPLSMWVLWPKGSTATVKP